jgi:hypothetical protein
VDTLEHHDQQELKSQLLQANAKLEGLMEDLRSVDAELQALADERQRYDLLRQVCDSLDELRGLGAADLFWPQQPEGGPGADHERRARARLEVFAERVAEIEGRRQAIVESIGEDQEAIEFLEEDLFQAQQQEERRKLEWIVEREISALPARRQVMPWNRGGEDDQRFRKSLTTALLVSLLLGILLPQIDLPIPERWEVIDVPERLAQLVRKERPPPPPPSTLEQPEPEEQPPEPEPEPIEEPLTPTDSPILANSPEPSEVPQKAEKKKQTETKGILAFREKFSNIAQNKPSARLGADARIGAAGDEAPGLPQRAMVTTQAPGSSGGINLASISRDVGGGGGGGQIAGFQLTRATSTIGGSGGQDRPLAGGAGAGRTDEEIQIVFDRHKAALYRLYNRQLRKNPTLQGQMVLRIRIEPNGSVSLCELEGTDMDAPTLSAQVVGRVRTFDFGAKDGIPAVTILYPIDFLPAT